MHGPNHVIRTAEFSIQPGEDSETNPGVFGRALADYLAAQLRSRGVGVEEVIPEDFGYCIMLKRKPLRLWIACANRAGRTDEWIAVAEGNSVTRSHFSFRCIRTSVLPAWLKRVRLRMAIWRTA